MSQEIQPVNTSQPAEAKSEIPNGTKPKPKFDVAGLRLSQNVSVGAGVQKAIITIPVRKPDKQWFVRVHPDPAYHFATFLLELKEERESYLVAPELWSELPGELLPTELAVAVNRQGVLFLWSLRLPGEDGRQLEWHRSAAEASQIAMTHWVKVQSNISLGAYEVYTATGSLPEPDWPDKPFDELLTIAFKDRYIDSMDHIILKKLRGEL